MSDSSGALLDDEPVPASERRVRTGGLMRCCLHTVGNSEEPSSIGTVLDCEFEEAGNARMVVAADGVWEWNRG